MKKSHILLISVLVIAVSIYAGIILNPTSINNETNPIIIENSHKGLEPSMNSIGKFGTITTLDEARSEAVNLKIKLLDLSVFPKGYKLQATLMVPRGPEMPETFSGELFRPEMIHLYYSDKPIDENTIVSEHPELIVISQSYTLGSNSTKAYTVNQTVSSDTEVGWFYGYPGYMKGGLLLVYQFKEHHAYRIYSPSLTQEQILAIAEKLLSN